MPGRPGSVLAAASRQRLALGALALAALAAVALPSRATAAIVSLSPADIQAFTQLSGSGSPVTFKTAESATGASYTTLWSFSVSGAQSADIGLCCLGYDWTGKDTFALAVANHNESPWSFSVSVSDGATTATSATQTLAPDGVDSLFSVDISGLNLAAIQSVFVTVSAVLPINGIDRTAEYRITVVPLPASAGFFVSALSLLVWMRRHALGKH